MFLIIFNILALKHIFFSIISLPTKTKKQKIKKTQIFPLDLLSIKLHAIFFFFFFPIFFLGHLFLLSSKLVVISFSVAVHKMITTSTFLINDNFLVFFFLNFSFCGTHMIAQTVPFWKFCSPLNSVTLQTPPTSDGYILLPFKKLRSHTQI